VIYTSTARSYGGGADAIGRQRLRPAEFPTLREVMRRVGPRAHPRTWTLALYLALSLAVLGWRILPNPATDCACQGNDPPTYMWALAWWPHALLHGLNPFWTNYVWYPVGANVARAASIPSAAFALWPVTALFGPLVSYNVLTIASPTLAAFTAYLLCRRIVGRELPAIVGGYLFGFGAYQFPQLVGHPNISLVFLVPLFVLLALRRLAREISGRRYVALMTVMFVVQLGLSTEVLVTTILIGFALLLAALALAPRPERQRVDRLMLETLAAGWIAAIVCSPFLYYALVKGGTPTETISDTYGLDLLNPFVPTVATWLGGATLHGISSKFEGGGFAEANGYLSLPIIAAFVIWTATTRRRFLARMLIITAVISFVFALGAHLHVAGSESVPLPYALIKNLPIIRLLTPSRLAMYLSLAVAIGVAAWLAEAPAEGSGRLMRWLVVALGALMVFPNPNGEPWAAPPRQPAFFRTATHRLYLQSGTVLLALPYAQDGTSMGWQAECDFCFRMPEGYLGHTGPSLIIEQQVANELGGNKEVDPAQLLGFVQRYGIGAIAVDTDPGDASPYQYEFARLGMHGITAGGVTIYYVSQRGL
jgi:hypothetical protein